jgi:predicted transport protein
MATWVEDVKHALENLGGQSSLNDLYVEVRRIRTGSKPKSLNAIVRRTLEDHSPDSKNFNGKDYFKNIDRGIWALTNPSSTQVIQKTKNEKGIKIIAKKGKEIIIPESYETLLNLLTTLKQYRLYADPKSKYWNEYIREFFHLFGFQTTQLDGRLFLLGDAINNNSPLAVLQIIHPDDDFEFITSDLRWETLVFFASKYHRVDWGIIVDGFKLCFLNCETDHPKQELFIDELDEVIEQEKFDKFFEIYKFLSKIKGAVNPYKRISTRTKRRSTSKTRSIEYDLNHHYKRGSHHTTMLFAALRTKILSLSDSVSEKYNKYYVAYAVNSNFCEIHFQKRQLKIWVNMPLEDIKGSKSLCRDVRKIGHYGTGDTEILIDNFADIDTVFGIIEQAFDATDN